MSACKRIPAFLLIVFSASSIYSVLYHGSLNKPLEAYTLFSSLILIFIAIILACKDKLMPLFHFSPSRLPRLAIRGSQYGTACLSLFSSSVPLAFRPSQLMEHSQLHFFLFSVLPSSCSSSLGSLSAVMTDLFTEFLFLLFQLYLMIIVIASHSI